MKTQAAGLRDDWCAELVRAKAHRDHGSDEFFAAIARIVDYREATQESVADQLHTSQGQVSRWAQKGRELIAAAAGKPGRTPYHAAQRYSRGEISRGELVQALVEWDWKPWDNKTAGQHDDLLNTVAGSFDDLIVAHADGLIDDELYDTIADALEARSVVRH